MKFFMDDKARIIEKLKAKDYSGLLFEKLDTLSEREQKALVMLHGIGKWEQKTYEETADYLGTSVERIRRIEESALKKLSHPIRIK